MGILTVEKSKQLQIWSNVGEYPMIYIYILSFSWNSMEFPLAFTELKEFSWKLLGVHGCS